MNTQRQSTVFQGEFGRVTLNLSARALVEHAHSEFNFIFKVGGADTGFRVNGTDHVLADDAAILVNPWEPHAKLASIEGATLAFTVLVHPEWALRAAGIAPSTGVKLFPTALVRQTPEVREAALRIAMALTSSDMHADDPETLLRELLQLLVNAYADPELARKLVFSGPAMDARVMRATHYMREKAGDNPGLDEIARAVGLSRSRFFEQFRHCLGVSPQQYLDWQRMALATRMLSPSDASVADVSYRLGFSAPSHFARFFAQHIGFPPSDFKRGMLSMPTADQG